jgi:hypothetical protein
MMHMHYAPTEKHKRQLSPMCGYFGPGDEICCDLDLCTCPECLGWVRPDHDTAKPGEKP